MGDDGVALCLLTSVSIQKKYLQVLTEDLGESLLEWNSEWHRGKGRDDQRKGCSTHRKSRSARWVIHV